MQFKLRISLVGILIQGTLELEIPTWNYTFPHGCGTVFTLPSGVSPITRLTFLTPFHDEKDGKLLVTYSPRLSPLHF